MYGNVNELDDVSPDPGKSFLFFLTACRPGISLAGERAQWLGKPAPFVPVQCVRDGP